MQDLKHLITFENLLDDAANEMVKEAQSQGEYAIGYTCYHMPEVLLNVDNCFSVRMRAPRTGSIDISTYYMSNYTCEFARSLLEKPSSVGVRDTNFCCLSVFPTLPSSFLQGPSFF